MSGDAGVSAFPEDENIFCWKGMISGSKDNVFKLHLSFPTDYPFMPSHIRFEKGSIHPSVDAFGYLLLEILNVNT